MDHQCAKWCKIWRVVILTIVLVFSLPSFLLAGELPPRPTPEPAPAPVEVVDARESVASITLHAAFSGDWPWYHLHGQHLVTVVQWQDGDGVWHDVEGWRGTFDQFDVAADGAAVGKKTWWLGAAHFGTGPFRWVVYRPSDWGQRLVTSESFDLPTRADARYVVAVALPLPSSLKP